LNFFLTQHFCSVCNIDIWHCHIDHISYDKINITKQNYTKIESRKYYFCSTCLCKTNKTSFPISNYVASKPFDFLHLDIWDPCNITYFQVYKYFLLVVNNKTRFTWIRLLNNRIEIRQSIKTFINFVEIQFETSVKKSS